MMPVMDGPATLAQLRQNVDTAQFPVVFMTARSQAREADRFRSLGAVGVIPKPFDPLTLAASLRKYVQPSPDPLARLQVIFTLRVKKDAAARVKDRTELRRGKRPPDTLDRIKRVAHALSGAGGIYGYAELGDAAAQLEDAVTKELAGQASGDETDRAFDGLIFQAEHHGNSGSPMV
jgi:HPt (histidine-containing phosphotransfer) domain-containing protein